MKFSVFHSSYRVKTTVEDQRYFQFEDITDCRKPICCFISKQDKNCYFPVFFNINAFVEASF